MRVISEIIHTFDLGRKEFVSKSSSNYCSLLLRVGLGGMTIGSFARTTLIVVAFLLVVTCVSCLLLRD